MREAADHVKSSLWLCAALLVFVLGPISSADDSFSTQHLIDLVHPVEDRREEAASLLERRPPPLPWLLVQLTSDGELVRAGAAEALGRLYDDRSDDSQQIVDALILATTDPAPLVQQSAASALGSFRPKSAVDALIALLESGPPFVTWSALETLEGIGGDARSAYEAGLKLLRTSTTTYTQELAVRLLVAVHGDRQRGDLVEELSVLFLGSGTAAPLRRAAGGALVNLADRGVDALRQGLESPWARDEAVVYLTRVGERGADAADRLQSLLESNVIDPLEGTRALYAVTANRKRVLVSLQRLIRAHEGHPRLRALKALAELAPLDPGGHDQALLSRLAADDPDPKVREAASDVLRGSSTREE